MNFLFSFAPHTGRRPWTIFAFVLAALASGHALNGAETLPLDAPIAPAEASDVDACCCQRANLQYAPRPIDTVWRISTRCAGCPRCGATPELRVSRFVAGAWTDSDLPAFLAAVQPGEQAVVYVHGNRVETYDAEELGWRMYAALACGAPNEKPLHFVIWSWPSGKESGPLRDARSHALRTAADGYYLGWMLSQLPDESPIGMIGFSYGARIITGALELLAGGQVAGQTLPAEETAGPHNVRAVLQSPALDRTWIMTGGAHQNFAKRVDTLLVQYNPCDPALKSFHITDRCSRPVALGYTGIGLYRPSEEKVEMVREENVSGFIGRSHSSYDYLDSYELMRRARAVLLDAPATQP